MPEGRVIVITLGTPFQLEDEECPDCGFNAMFAVLVIIGLSPSFKYLCGRCRAEDQLHA
jgi:DNA-directed RNA polymerase subunit RPC12/RpoP